MTRDETLARLREAERAEAVAMADWSEAQNAGYDEAGARAVALVAQARREALESGLRLPAARR